MKLFYFLVSIVRTMFYISGNYIEDDGCNTPIQPKHGLNLVVIMQKAIHWATELNYHRRSESQPSNRFKTDTPSATTQCIMNIHTIGRNLHLKHS